MGVLKEYFKDIYCKIKYNSFSINKEKAIKLREKNEQANLKKIRKKINSMIKKNSCLCKENTVRFVCEKAFGSTRYFLIKNNREQILLTQDHFYFLINYYIEKGFIITYTKRSERIDEDYCKKEAKLKDKVLFDVKTLEPIIPENCNFYIEW